MYPFAEEAVQVFKDELVASCPPVLGPIRLLQTLHARKLRINTVVHCMFLFKQTFRLIVSYHVCYYA